MSIASTHTEEVPNIGTFTFRRRTIRDQVGIEAEELRILGGPCADKELRTIARAIAELAALTVTAPEGWSVADVDPFDDEAMARVFLVYGVLRAAGARFRRGAGA